MAVTMKLRPAIFVDKDGTLIHDVPYNVDPSQIRLREGAANALRRLQSAGYALVLVSNQPGVALGRFPEARLGDVSAHLHAELSGHGVRFEAFQYCPHHPDGTVDAYALPCLCRKPQPGMLLRAAAEHGLDLTQSWMVGDILDDVEAGSRAGCRTILLDVGSETEWVDGDLRRPDAIAITWGAVVDTIMSLRKRSPAQVSVPTSDDEARGARGIRATRGVRGTRGTRGTRAWG